MIFLPSAICRDVGRALLVTWFAGGTGHRVPAEINRVTSTASSEARPVELRKLFWATWEVTHVTCEKSPPRVSLRNRWGLL